MKAAIEDATAKELAFKLEHAQDGYAMARGHEADLEVQLRSVHHRYSMEHFKEVALDDAICSIPSSLAAQNILTL